MTKYRELYNLDPSLRLKIDLSDKESSQTQSEKLFAAVQSDIFTTRLLQTAWEEFRRYRCEVDGEPSENSHVTAFLDGCGLKEVMKHVTSNMHAKSLSKQIAVEKPAEPLKVSKCSRDETVDCIRESRIAWERGISEELALLVKESRRPFVTARPGGILNPHLEEDSGESLENVRFLFDSEDLLETAVAISDNRVSEREKALTFGVLRFRLSTPTLGELITRFSELSISNIQFGLDDLNLKHGNRFCVQRHEEGESVILRGDQVVAQTFLKNGVTPSQRPQIWRIAMGLHHTRDSTEHTHYTSLRLQCDELDILTDDLYLLDVQSVADDHRFFPFGDVLKELVLCFSRDTLDCVYDVHGSGSGLGVEGVSGGAGRGGESDPAAKKDTDKSRNTATSSSGSGSGSSARNSGSGSGGGDSTHGVRASYPSSSSRSSPSPSPSGCTVQPFLGLASYTAPLCYLYTDKAALYSMSTQLWAKLWCKLNVISGDRGALLYVCKTFENLLATLDPKLLLHLLSINIQPLRVAFPWLQLSFVSFFEIDQLLILWDRVIGFTDLTLFSLLAVAIFISRSEVLLNCPKPEKALIILNEGSGLKVVPLLQMILFSGK